LEAACREKTARAWRQRDLALHHYLWRCAQQRCPNVTAPASASRAPAGARGNGWDFEAREPVVRFLILGAELESTVIAVFDTRREAELAVEHVVQEYSVERSAMCSPSPRGRR
jgi:hypothetical protein